VGEEDREEYVGDEPGIEWCYQGDAGGATVVCSPVEELSSEPRAPETDYSVSNGRDGLKGSANAVQVW
jgi:hypothetical protein